MFNNASEVNDASINDITRLVELSSGVSAVDILTKEKAEAYRQAELLVRKTDSNIEAIAFAIRRRFTEYLETEDYFYDGDEEDDIDEFMNSLAQETGQQYNGEREDRPDYFWVPSNCY